MELSFSTNFHEDSTMLNRSSLNQTPAKNLLNRSVAGKSNLFNEYTIDLSKTINLVQFSPFDNSYDILACCTQECVNIFRIQFSNADDLSEELKFDYQFIQDYITGSKCTSICFSPKTDFSQVDNNFLSFAVAGDDFGIVILSQLFVDENVSKNDIDQKFVTGHGDFINDMVFEPISGDLLASTSDDCTCCVWSLADDNQNINLEMKILLSSPGISVKWHKSEPNKLFVAEKRGLIRFYDTNSQVAVMTFDCKQYPLMSSDWCNDGLSIGCISGKDIFFWDTSLTSLPIKVLKTNSDGLSEFEFFDSKLIAFRGRPNNYLRITNFTNNQVYVDKEFIAGRGISWNQKLPILAAGGSKSVHIFKINLF